MSLDNAQSPAPVRHFFDKQIKTLTSTQDQGFSGFQNAAAYITFTETARGPFSPLYEGVAAQLNPPGTPATSPTLTKEMVRTAPGQRPGAAVGAVVTKTVVIDSIDTATNVVTFHEATLPQQHPLTVTVKRPQFQAMLKTLKPGDQVSLSFFEALAVSVQPMAK